MRLGDRNRIDGAVLEIGQGALDVVEIDDFEIAEAESMDRQGVVQQHLQRVAAEGAGLASLQLAGVRDLRPRHDGDAHQSAAADDDRRIVAGRVDQRFGEGDGAKVGNAGGDDVGRGRQRRESRHLDVEAFSLEQSGGLRDEQRKVGQGTAVRQRDA